MIDKLILVNASAYFSNAFGNYTLVSSGKENMGLLTIREALETKGFYNTHLVPSRPLVVSDYTGNEELIKELKSAAGDSKNVLFGVSSTTDHYYMFETISRVIRRNFPESQVVAGGPHFRRDRLADNGQEYKDSVQLAFQRKLLLLKEGIQNLSQADAVVVGHAQPIIEWVTGNLRIEEILCPGFYRLDKDDKVIGSGTGKFPQIRYLPYVASEDYITMMVRDSCGNACDFCCLGGGVNSSFDLALTSLIKAFRENPEKNRLLLHDSNPFKDGVNTFYRDLFGGLERELDKPIFKDIYLDPGALAIHNDSLIEFFRKYNVFAFSLGRDAVTFDNASFMGTRLNGIVRDQQQIDDEGKALKLFIKELGKRRGQNEPKYQFRIHYILTPVETRESAMKMISEMRDLHSMSNDNLDVEIKLFGLTAEPGTALFRKHIGKVLLPQDYNLRTTYINSWKDDVSPGVHLLETVPLIMGDTEKDLAKRMDAVEKAIDAVFSGRYKPMDRSEPKNLRLSLAVGSRDFIEPYLS